MLSCKHSFVDHLGKNRVFLLKKPFFLIWMRHGCLLGCEADVGRLTTWWAALKHTLRIKLFIQNGDMYPARLTPWRGFYLPQLSFTGQSPMKISLHKSSGGKARADYDDSSPDWVVRGVKRFMISGLTDASDLGDAGVHRETWASYGAPHWWKLARISSLKNRSKEAVISALRWQQHLEDNRPPAYKGLRLQIEKEM